MDGQRISNMFSQKETFSERLKMVTCLKDKNVEDKNRMVKATGRGGA